MWIIVILLLVLLAFGVWQYFNRKINNISVNKKFSDNDRYFLELVEGIAEIYENIDYK